MVKHWYKWIKQFSSHMSILRQHFVYMKRKRKILSNPISIFDNLWSAIGDARRYSTLCFKDFLDFSQVLYHERKEVSTQHNVNLKRKLLVCWHNKNRIFQKFIRYVISILFSHHLQVVYILYNCTDMEEIVQFHFYYNTYHKY